MGELEISVAPLVRLTASEVQRFEDMGVDQIQQAVIYPTYGLMIQGVRDAEAAPALCRAVNDWLASYCRHDPQRLFGVGVGLIAVQR